VLSLLKRISERDAMFGYVID
jgi:hypothetical protein